MGDTPPSPVGDGGSTSGKFSDYRSWLIYRFVVLKDPLKSYKSGVFSKTVQDNVQLLPGGTVVFVITSTKLPMKCQPIIRLEVEKQNGHEGFPDFCVSTGRDLSDSGSPLTRFPLTGERFLPRAHRESSLGRELRD
jgi:hypothetical protein